MENLTSPFWRLCNLWFRLFMFFCLEINIMGDKSPISVHVIFIHRRFMGLFPDSKLLFGFYNQSLVGDIRFPASVIIQRRAMRLQQISSGANVRTEYLSKRKISLIGGHVMAKDISSGSPIQIQSYLKGVHYPTSKDDLIKMAQKNKAPAKVMKIIEKLPEEEYESPIEVMRAYRQEHLDQEQAGGDMNEHDFEEEQGDMSKRSHQRR